MTTVWGMQRKVDNPDGNPADDESVEIAQRFSDRLKLLLELRAIEAADLSRKISSNRFLLWSVLDGRRGPKITAIVIARLADALDVDSEWLYLGRGSGHAFARNGFIACGLAASSPLWPKAVPRLVEAIVSDRRPVPKPRKMPLPKGVKKRPRLGG